MLLLIRQKFLNILYQINIVIYLNTLTFHARKFAYSLLVTLNLNFECLVMTSVSGEKCCISNKILFMKIGAFVT